MARTNPIVPLALLGAGLILLSGGKKSKSKNGTAPSQTTDPNAAQRAAEVEALPASYFEADAKEEYPGDRVIPEMLAPGQPNDMIEGP